MRVRTCVCTHPTHLDQHLANLANFISFCRMMLAPPILLILAVDFLAPVMRAGHAFLRVSRESMCVLVTCVALWVCVRVDICVDTRPTHLIPNFLALMSMMVAPSILRTLVVDFLTPVTHEASKRVLSCI